MALISVLPNLQCRKKCIEDLFGSLLSFKEISEDLCWTFYNDMSNTCISEGVDLRNLVTLFEVK